ncbi:peptidylprolyl isomerase [Paenibacillus thiaminolyticus]|uniref:peptidylprolyl isomerase n=1 Tax=Paenibacillus thiaminolyticus TaxID=49283 RepID=UPI0035A7191A
MRRSNRQRTVLTLMALLIISMVVVAGCGSKAGNASGGDSAKHPLVTIEMESGKKIEVELYPDTAPNTVNNFISLVNKGFYDGLIFHRVIPGFMIQGGDPQGTGIGGPGYSIKGEFSSNGVTNDLKHTEGVISMARSMDPDSAGSQFFIMDADAPHLDEQYAAFGKVTSGIETVHDIANVNRDASDRPAEDQKIKKITVDTFGVEYKEPETIKEPESK